MSGVPRAPREPRRETVRVRGLGMNLTRWAGAGGPPLVMLHGWLDCGESFQYVVDSLPRELEVVAPDWRGFGRSEWAADGYWFPDYLADLDALLDLLVPGMPAAIAGHSMGGHVACLYAGVRPTRVLRLVNLEGLGLPATTPAQAPERLRTWLDQLRHPAAPAEYESFDAFAAAIRRRHPKLARERAAAAARLWGEVGADGSVRAAGDPRHRRINPILYRREETEACWREIAAPTLLLLGAESPFALEQGAAERVAAFQTHVRAVETAWIAEAGHMMHLEQPEAVARAIAAFAASH